MAEIRESDLALVSDGVEAFSQALKPSSASQLVWALGDYIEFNSVFGACAANLAGKIATSRIFTDPQEPIAVLADRGYEVARGIFAAIVDEFGIPGKTHRALAQEAFRSAVEFFGYCNLLDRMWDTGLFSNRTEIPSRETVDAMQQVKKGYGADKDYVGNVFPAIGFHIGSERYAGEEFRTLDRALRGGYPELVGHMEKDGSYTYIQLHTTVEDEHYRSAMNSANLALRYSKPNDREYNRAEMLWGFKNFGRVQANFMKSLAGRDWHG